MEAYFVDAAAALPDDFPVYLYNIPQCSTNDLKPATAARIAGRRPNVVGIKYSWADFIRANEYRRIADGTFSVVIGTDRLFLPGLAMGCDGTVSGVSCVVPEAFTAVRDAFGSGDLERARPLQARATEICELLRNGSNMAYFKAGLRSRGIAAGHMRRPLADLPAEEERRIGEALSRLLAAPVQAPPSPA